MSKELRWHFIDYPEVDENAEDGLSDELLALDTDGHLMIVVWDSKNHRWLDVGKDYDWFGTGIVAWAYVEYIPETRKAMQSYTTYMRKKNMKGGE